MNGCIRYLPVLCIAAGSCSTPTHVSAHDFLRKCHELKTTGGSEAVELELYVQLEWNPEVSNIVKFNLADGPSQAHGKITRMVPLECVKGVEVSP